MRIFQIVKSALTDRVNVENAFLVGTFGLLLLGSIYGVTILDAEARCSRGIPCSAGPTDPYAVQYWEHVEVVVIGKVIEKKYNQDALDNFNSTNPENPCNLPTTEMKLTVDLELPFSERIANREVPTKYASFLEESDLNSPYKFTVKIDKSYKKHDLPEHIEVYGIERSKIFGQQFSEGYKVDPKIGEDVQLYLNHHDTVSFGDCIMNDIYKVHPTQGSIWVWNYDDYTSDIYPKDFFIPSLKEQIIPIALNHNEKYEQVFGYRDLVCPLGKELMYKVSNPNDKPRCFFYENVSKLKERGFAKIHGWEEQMDLSKLIQENPGKFSPVNLLNIKENHIFEHTDGPIPKKLAEAFSTMKLQSDTLQTNFEVSPNNAYGDTPFIEGAIIITPNGVILTDKKYYESKRELVYNSFDYDYPLNGYEKYFSDYLPSGQELKFVEFYPPYDRFYFIFAPMSSNITFFNTTQEIFEQDGVIVTIQENEDYLDHLIETNHLGIGYDEIPTDYNLEGITSKTFDQRIPNDVYVQFNSTMIHLESFGVDIDELLNMIDSVQ